LGKLSISDFTAFPEAVNDSRLEHSTVFGRFGSIKSVAAIISDEDLPDNDELSGAAVSDLFR
jgi:hypothetical protein